MHKFTDEDVSEVEVGEYYDLGSETPRLGVFFDTTYDQHTSCTFLSKEDLLHLLKLIEETN